MTIFSSMQALTPDLFGRMLDLGRSLTPTLPNELPEEVLVEQG
jgi:hypothetical protein